MKKVIRLTEGDLTKIVKRVLRENSIPSDFDDLSDDDFDRMGRFFMDRQDKSDEYTYYDPTIGGKYVNDYGSWGTPEKWEDYEFGDFTELKRSVIPNENYRKLRTRRDFDTLKNPDTGKVHIRKRLY